MASNELIIDDDYCRAMGSYFTKQGEELDQLIVDYISILQDVKNKGITSGDVSNALSSYINYVKNSTRRLEASQHLLRLKLKTSCQELMQKINIFLM